MPESSLERSDIACPKPFADVDILQIRNTTTNLSVESQDKILGDDFEIYVVQIGHALSFSWITVLWYLASGYGFGQGTPSRRN